MIQLSKYMFFLLFALTLSSFSRVSQGCMYNSQEIMKTDSITNWIDNLVMERMGENNIPAFSIGVIRNGEVILQKGYGVHDRDNKMPVNETSMYQIASVSKTLTAIVTNSLIKQGKLTLEDAIIDFLPESIEQGAKKRMSAVTIKHLLDHTAGIPDYHCQVYKNWKVNNYWTKGYPVEDLIQDINSVQLEFEPGAKYSYSNSGYAFLGYICERVGQKSYEDLLQQFIVQKYGLSHMTSSVKNVSQDMICVPYLPFKRNVATTDSDWGMGTPASGVYSNISDLVKLVNVQMETYASDSEKAQNSPLLLNDKSIDLENGIYYEMGMQKVVDDYGTWFVHEGDSDGYRSAYIMSAEDDVALVMLSSSGGDWFAELGNQIFSGLTDRPFEIKKKSLAQELINVIMQQDIENGIRFFQDKLGSPKYYLLEDEMNQVGYALLQRERIVDAIEVFSLVVDSFPESANAYDSSAEAYHLEGNDDAALENYRRSYELNPENSGALEMIKKLSSEK